jgi:hypothetical protein
MSSTSSLLPAIQGVLVTVAPYGAILSITLYKRSTGLANSTFQKDSAAIYGMFKKITPPIF